MENQHILVVVKSLNLDHYGAIKDTLATFRRCGADVSLLHVVSEVPAYYYQIPSIASVQEELLDDAWDFLAQVGDMLDVSLLNQWAEVGAFRKTVNRVIEELDIDLACVISGAEKKILDHSTHYTMHSIVHA